MDKPRTWTLPSYDSSDLVTVVSLSDFEALKADRDDYKAGAAVEAREADRLREELATAKQEHDSLVIEISDDRKMLTLLSTQLVQAKAVFNEPSFEAFLAKRLGAYSDEDFVTDTFTTKDMVGLGRDCAKWQDSQLKADRDRLREAMRSAIIACDSSRPRLARRSLSEALAPAVPKGDK